MKKNSLFFMVLAVFSFLATTGIPGFAEEPASMTVPPGEDLLENQEESPVKEASGSEVSVGNLGEDIPDWQARWELARVLSYSKKYEESLKEYRAVLKENPALTAAREEMIVVLLWSGKSAEALAAFKSLPASEVSLKTRLAFVDLFIAEKTYDKAQAILETHLKSSPNDLAARLKLANVLSWTKQYDASIAEFRKILAARPGDVQIRRRLANVLIWADRKAEAAIELKKSFGEK